MTKAEAWEILSNRVRDQLISELIYNDPPTSANVLIAVLSDIDSCAETLRSVIGKDE